MPLTSTDKDFTLHFEALFKHASMGILVTDGKGKIITINPYGAKEFGWSKKELADKPIEVLIPPRYRKHHATHHKSFLQMPESRMMGKGREITAIKKNGVEIPVEISLSFYRRNKEDFVIAFVTNISERKKAAAQIAKMNAQLEAKIEQRTGDLQKTLHHLEAANHKLEQAILFQNALLQHAGAMIIATNKEGIIQIFNRAAETHLGYKANEVIGKHSPVLFHCPVQTKQRAKQFSEELSEKIEPGFETYIAKARKNMMYEDEWMYVRKDGTHFPVTLIVTALRNNGDEITGYMGVSANISERKKAEEQIHAVTTMLNNIIQNYPDGTLSVIDKNYNYIFVGGEGVKLLKLNSEKMIGTRLFPLINDAAWKEIQPVIQKVFEGKKATDIALPKVIDGLQFTFDAFPLREMNGDIQEIAVMTRNVSELKKTQEELQNALQKEKELGELKSRFVAMASHEFRTPLSTILSSANLLERYTAAEDQPKRNRHIQYIISSVSMLTDTLNDFLSVGKIEEGKINVKASVIDVSRFMKTVIEEMKPSLKPKQRIKFTHTGNQTVVLDPSLLKHIVMNLLSNAGKFSPDHTTIFIKSNAGNEQFTLSVKDEGIGISKEDQQHLMERFFRGANAENVQGTGLGLHIVSKYAELLNGTVQCKSELEKGTEFVLTFHKTKNGLYEKDTADRRQ
ncbi:MAG: PAS domain S-box protein [Chitinophagaceae bacterium]|nr:PAS domain S-box protein [Chitinophagaceae bacterium]